MLTRLRVKGFKSLVDVDVRFGPFTCIAGANGVGKSNLFDAIRFLSALADNTLIDAAKQVRYEGERSPDIRSLFTRYGERRVNEMSFEAEMIVPKIGVDRLGQTAEAKPTFLRYRLVLGYREDGISLLQGGLRILEEELTYIPKGEAAEHLGFPHSAKAWRESVLEGRRTSPFISTSTEAKIENGMEERPTYINIHQEGTGGNNRKLLAERLPRTVLSESNAAESPTAAVARFEMLSWRLLQLEPAALRRSDHFTDPSQIDLDGSHLPHALFHRAQEARAAALEDEDAAAAEARVYAEIAGRLAELLTDVREVRIERDDRRELLTLEVAGRDGAFHPARSLSDGTLRFLALAVLEASSEGGLLCLEEPENGIHPARIEPMLRLLQDIATDTEEAVGPDNPLRQVVINTHSPSVVKLVPDHCLLVADRERQMVSEGLHVAGSSFLPLEGTWRVKGKLSQRSVPKGRLMAYLNPVPLESDRNAKTVGRRVIDREDVRQLLLPL